MPDNKHMICLYGLSTCVHCRHAKEYLEANDCDFACVFVDKLEGEERAKTIAQVREHNPKLSFPTIVIDNGDTVLVGFEKAQLEKALKK